MLGSYNVNSKRIWMKKFMTCLQKCLWHCFECLALGLLFLRVGQFDYPFWWRIFAVVGWANSRQVNENVICHLKIQHQNIRVTCKECETIKLQRACATSCLNYHSASLIRFTFPTVSLISSLIKTMLEWVATTEKRTKMFEICSYAFKKTCRLYLCWKM